MPPSPWKVANIHRVDRRWYQIVGLTMVAGAAPASTWLAGSVTGRAWSKVIDDTMSDRSGAWHLMRGGLAFLVIPTLLVGVILMLLFLYRRGSLRSLVLLGSIGLLGNVTAQFVKRAPFGLGEAWSTLNPLSGHVAMTTSVALGWLVVVPPRWRLVSTVGALVAIGGVSSGVILAGWHTPFQVFCPLLISSGWAVAFAALMNVSQEHRHSADPDHEQLWLERLLVLIGLGAVASVTVLVARASGDGVGSIGSIELAVLAAGGASSAAVGLAARARVTRLDRPTLRFARPEPGRVEGHRSKEEGSVT